MPTILQALNDSIEILNNENAGHFAMAEATRQIKAAIDMFYEGHPWDTPMTKLELSKYIKNEPESLTELYSKIKSDKFAYCENCERLFIDDYPLMGSIYCPICQKFALSRNYKIENKEEQLYGICQRCKRIFEEWNGIMECPYCNYGKLYRNLTAKQVIEYQNNLYNHPKVGEQLGSQFYMKD